MTFNASSLYMSWEDIIKSLLKLRDLCLKYSVCLLSSFVEVCLKDTMSVADSLYNLQLIREFCNDHLQGCCPLVLEDLLYAPPILRVRRKEEKRYSNTTDPHVAFFFLELFLDDWNDVWHPGKYYVLPGWTTGCVWSAETWYHQASAHPGPDRYMHAPVIIRKDETLAWMLVYLH